MRGQDVGMWIRPFFLWGTSLFIFLKLERECLRNTAQCGWKAKWHFQLSNTTKEILKSEVQDPLKVRHHAKYLRSLGRTLQELQGKSSIYLKLDRALQSLKLSLTEVLINSPHWIEVLCHCSSYLPRGKGEYISN